MSLTSQDIRKQIIALVSDVAKKPQLAEFIDHAQTMRKTVGIDLLNTCDEYLRNLITLSIIHDNLDAMQMLIDAGVDINAGDMLGVTPLHAAVFLNRIHAVNLLISSRAELDKTDLNAGSGGEVYLCNKASDQQKKIYNEYEYKENDGSFMHYYGIDDDLVDTRYNTPLFMACVFGREEIFKKLLAAGADLSASFKHGYSPLYAAIRGGHTAIAKFLLERVSFDVDFVCEDGLTATDQAIFYQRFEILDMLLSRKAKSSYWYFKEKNSGYVNERNHGSGWNLQIKKSIIELYISKSIDNYLNDLIAGIKSNDKDVIDFHFNYNADVFCDFVRYQFTPVQGDKAESNVKAPTGVPQFIRLSVDCLAMLIKKLLALNVATDFLSHSLTVEQRQALLLNLFCDVGTHLYGQEIPAVYLFLKKSSNNPQAQHLLVNMLYAEIKLLRNEAAVGLNPEMTLGDLKKAYPQDYANAEASLQRKAEASLNSSQEEPAPAAAEVSKVAKRHSSPLHSKDEQQPSKVTRQEEKPAVGTLQSLSLPIAKR